MVSRPNFVSVMSDDALLAAPRTLFDALGDHDADRAAQVLAPDYSGRDVTRAADTEGRAAARHEMGIGLDAFPDLSFARTDSLLDAPHVSVWWQMDAVHEGAFLNIPPTHQSVTVTGVSTFTVRDERITHGKHLWDLAGLLRSLKLLPDMPGSDSEAEKGDPSIFDNGAGKETNKES